MNEYRSVLWRGWLCAVTLIACQPPVEDVSLYQLGNLWVSVTPTSVRVLRSDGSVLLGGLPAEADPGASGQKIPGLLGWRNSKSKIEMSFGMFLLEEQAPPWIRAAGVTVISAGAGRLELSVAGATGVFETAGKGVMRVTWKVDREGPNRLVQSFSCKAGDRFFGLGALVHGTEHRGEVIPTWISEQGHGKVRRTPQNPKEGFPLWGDVHDTYLSVPFVLSSRGFGLLVEDGRRSVFHLCPADSADRWAVEVWRDTLRYLVIDGPQPVQVIERLTAITGRPRLPPKWAFAPWIDAVFGQQNVRDTARRLRKEGIPSSIIWTEDWVGGEDNGGHYRLKIDWSADTKLYPDLKQLSTELHGSGFRFLGYFSPFIEKGTLPWKEALDRGYAIKDADGKQITFSGIFFEDTTLPDLTDTRAVAWVQGYLKRALDLGLDGWMADFAEWLPVEARLADGRTGAEVHNLYPLLWQKTHSELLDSRRPDGDSLFFVRSGWSGTGGLAPVVWAGDQQTEFGGLDGMASVIPLCVNAGISGIPIMTHDIGGYSSVLVPNTTRELFFRWTALGAFSPIMRTHHGADAKKNWRWDRDAGTVTHFRNYARIHTSLFPYRYSLAREAARSGIPMVRHLVLHHASDPKVAAIKDQFLLGPDLLVAPVLEDKARNRQVYLPPGVWFHYFTGARYDGGKEHSIAARLEEIPVFAPAGAIIPTFLASIDTLDRASDLAVADVDVAEKGPLGIRVYLGAGRDFSMYDGMRIRLVHHQTPAGPPGLSVDGMSIPACQGGATDGCYQVAGSRAVTFHWGPTMSFRVSGKNGTSSLFSLEVKGAPRARRFAVTIRW